MIDSGNRISTGYLDFYPVYKAMVDTALSRPAQAEVQAYCRRVGDRLQFHVQVRNLSGATLSDANSAAVHGIVYEEAQVKVTNWFGRAAVATDISALAPGATASFELETPALVGVNWDKLHAVALVDYRPAGFTGPYDLLQAAVAPLALRGDLDGDCDVDIVDIMQVAARWSARTGDPAYAAQYDLDGDGDIDIVDIMTVAALWGQTCS